MSSRLVRNFRTKIFGGIVGLALALLPTALAAADVDADRVNIVRLKGGIEVLLPSRPTEPAHIALFDSMTVAEQESFYVKRAWLVKKLAGGLAKPGLGRTVSWAKNKVVTAIKGKPDLVESTIAFETVPAGVTDETKIYVETGITSLVNNLWSNSTDIARSTGVGITLVIGAVWNTTAGKWGLIAGRAVSVDIGIDFRADRGYMNFYVDRYSKSQGGLSFDIGGMMDVLIHVGKPSSQTGHVWNAQHQKLPVVGCFRYGPNYRAWGSQLGLHVVEIASAVAITMGYPEAGAAALTAIRTIGFMTMYRTSVDRVSFKTATISPDNWLLRRLGLGKLSHIFAGRTCRDLFREI